MNPKEMITSIVTAIVVIGIFAAMIGLASAGQLDISKETYPNPNAGYTIGETITYELIVTNPNDECGCTVDVYDRFPNGTEVLIEDDLHLAISGVSGDEKTYHVTYVVDANDIGTDDRVWNRLRIDGVEDPECNGPLAGSVWESSLISTDITFDFSFVGTDCMKVKFTGESTGPVAWHRWNFGDGTQSAVISGAPDAGNAVTRQYTSPGVKTVKLYGESVTSNPGEKQLAVLVTGDPTATAMANGVTGSITLPEGGGMVTLTGTATPYTGTIITSTTWSIPGATPSTGTGLGPLPVSVTDTTTATLTVVASNECSTTASVLIRVERPQQEVPLLTLPGLLALIGMMCIVGAGRIITRGRRS